MKKNISEEIVFNVEFYDVDSMRIVWHGNYVKYMEASRCALLNKIGYNYNDMEASGVAFPLVDIHFKYVRSLRFMDRVRAVATLVEWENCIKIKYEFYNVKTGELTTKAESTQMGVDIASGETMFVCPEIFVKKVEAMLNE
ncbi:MAG: acyl-CoA thioesterase [Treponema sp.]|nr:acyl-CoA thioesterase [Treponema sp.]